MYDIKWLSETGWAVAIAVGVVLFEALVTFDEGVMAEPKTWAVGLLTSGVRVVGATMLNAIRKRGGA
jgi:hypothetical protein